MAKNLSNPYFVFYINSIFLTNLCRLTATNGELTITKSHGPPPSHSSCSSSSNQATNHQHSSSMKLSPSSMQLSPTGTDNSNTDLLSESPGKSLIYVILNILRQEVLSYEFRQIKNKTNNIFLVLEHKIFNNSTFALFITSFLNKLSKIFIIFPIKMQYN